MSPALQADSLLSEPPGKRWKIGEHLAVSLHPGLLPWGRLHAPIPPLPLLWRGEAGAVSRHPLPPTGPGMQGRGNSVCCSTS